MEVDDDGVAGRGGCGVVLALALDSRCRCTTLRDIPYVQKARLLNLRITRLRRTDLLNLPCGACTERIIRLLPPTVRRLRVDRYLLLHPPLLCRSRPRI